MNSPCLPAAQTGRGAKNPSNTMITTKASERFGMAATATSGVEKLLHAICRNGALEANFTTRGSKPRTALVGMVAEGYASRGTGHEPHDCRLPSDPRAREISSRQPEV